MPPPNPTHRAAQLLVDEFARLPVTKTVLEQVALGARRKVGGLWGASAGLLLAAVVRKHKGPVLVLTADDVDSLQLQTDLAAFGVASHVLPREEQDDTGEPDPATKSARQRAIQHHASDRAPLIAGIEALLQKVATPKSLSKAQLELHQGQTIDRTQILQRAQAAGLRSVPLVLAPGECSVRGDVVDLFPMGADSAVRLEFFDRTLESIRTFDAGSQRTTAVHERFVLALGQQASTDEGSVLKHLTPSQTLVIAFEPLRIDERQARLLAFTNDLRHAIHELQDTLQPCARLEVSSLPSHGSCPGRRDRWRSPRRRGVLVRSTHSTGLPWNAGSPARRRRVARARPWLPCAVGTGPRPATDHPASECADRSPARRRRRSV